MYVSLCPAPSMGKKYLGGEALLIRDKEALDAGVEKNRKQDEETQNNDGLKKGHGHGQDMPEPHTVAVSHDNCSMRMLDLKVKSAYIVFEIIARVKNRRLWRNTYE